MGGYHWLSDGWSCLHWDGSILVLLFVLGCEPFWHFKRMSEVTQERVFPICWARTSMSFIGTTSGPSSIELSAHSHSSVIGFSQYHSAHIQFISPFMEPPWRLMDNPSLVQYPVPQIPSICVDSNSNLNPLNSAKMSRDQCPIFWTVAPDKNPGSR